MTLTPVFLKYVVEKSIAKTFDEAKCEWLYIGQVKHMTGVQSTAVLEPRLNRYSIAFYNYKTNAILHTNTHNQYLLHQKGRDRNKIVVTNSDGNGESEKINETMIAKIHDFIKSVNVKHKIKQMDVPSIKRLIMYNYFLNDIDIIQKESIKNFRYDMDHLLTIYKINCCYECNIEYLYRFFQPNRLCVNCYNLKNNLNTPRILT